MFSNFSIRGKIYILAVSGLLNLVVLFSVFQWMDYEISLLNSAVEESSELKIDVLTLRKHEKDFFARGDMKYVKKFQTTTDEFDEHYKKLIGLLGEAEIKNHKFKEFSGAFHQYQSFFKATVKIKQTIGLTPKLGLRGQLRNSVHDAEVLISKAGAIQLTADILMLRRREKDFLMRKDPKYLDKFNQDYQTFLVHLHQSQVPKVTQGKIEDLMASYKTDFLTLAEAFKTLGFDAKSGLHGKMRSAIHLSSKIEAREFENLEKMILENREKYRLSLVLINLGLGMVLIVLIVSLVKSIINPIVRITESLEELVGGEANLNNRIPVTSKDEIGEVANLFNQFLGNLRVLVETILGNAESMSSVIGNVDGEKLSLEKSRAIMLDISESNGSAIQELNSNARTVAANAEQANANMKQVEGATSSLNDDLQTIAGAAEEASVNIAQVRDNSKSIANQVVDVALPSTTELVQALGGIHDQTGKAEQIVKLGVEGAENNKESMTKLNEVATSISQIIKMISTIANQTNMLALNATIEAASAGQAGKGFAVVAAEVKKLSNETNIASNNVSERINQIQGLVNSGYKEAQEVAGMMNKISAINQDIECSVKGQTEKSKELFKTIESIGDATKESASMIAEASIGIREITSSAAKISQDGKITEKNTREAALGVSEIARSINEMSQGTEGINQNNLKSKKATDNNSEILKRIFSYFNSLSDLSKDQNLAVSKVAKGGEQFFYSSDQLYTGLEAVDNKHKAIIESVNLVYQACSSGDQASQAENLENLCKVAKAHFTEEEQIFGGTKYPGAQDHYSDHKKILVTIEGLLEEGKKGILGEEALGQIKDAFQNHFLIVDKGYLEFLPTGLGAKS